MSFARLPGHGAWPSSDQVPVPVTTAPWATRSSQPTGSKLSPRMTSTRPWSCTRDARFALANEAAAEPSAGLSRFLRCGSATGVRRLRCVSPDGRRDDHAPGGRGARAGHPGSHISALRGGAGSQRVCVTCVVRLTRGAPDPIFVARTLKRKVPRTSCESLATRKVEP